MDEAETEAEAGSWDAEATRLTNLWDEQHVKMDENLFFMDDAEAQMRDMKETFEIDDAWRQSDKANADLSVAYASNEVVKITKTQNEETIAANTAAKATATAVE